MKTEMKSTKQVKKVIHSLLNSVINTKSFNVEAIAASFESKPSIVFLLNTKYFIQVVDVWDL